MTSGLMTEFATKVDRRAAPIMIEGRVGQPALLLLHGLTASPTEVQPLADHLHRRWPDASISCPLLPGHGTTAQQLSTVRREAWIAVSQSELERLARKSDQIVVIGVSMGAVLAAHLAATHSCVRSLAMLSPMFFLKPALRACLPWLRFVVPYKVKSRASIDNHIAKGLFSYDRYPTRSLMELQRMANRTFAQLGDIACPVLIAVGKLDRYMTMSTMRKVCARLTASPLEIVTCEQSGHVLPHEPDAEMLFEKIHAHVLRSLE